MTERHPPAPGRGLCECGCGQKTNLADGNNAAKGWVKGEPVRYVSGHQTRAKRRRGGGRPPMASPGKWRDHPRATDGSPETLRACLLAFGMSEEDLALALRKRTAESLHWGAWRASGRFRRHCRCEVPDEVLESLERAS